MKTVYSTGEAAKVSMISQQMIIRAFDVGTLKGFRIPGSKTRRIPRAALLRWMSENGIPTDLIDDDQAGPTPDASEPTPAHETAPAGT